MGLTSSTPILKSASSVRLGILSVARITPRAIITPASLLSSITVEAVASRSLEKAKEFALKHNIPRYYGTYDELLDDNNIDAIYIPLPNSLHCEWTIKALQKGKHVLCEKPLASNAEEAQLMVDEAKKTNKILVEAAHYRYHPLAKRVQEILDSGEIGKVTHCKATFCLASYLSLFVSEAKADDIRFQYDLAGGILMDAGFYPVNVVRWIMGKEPVEVTSAKPTLMSPQVDSGMEASFKFDDGSTAQIVCNFRDPSFFPFDSSFEVQGELGTINCFNFLAPSFYHSLTITTKEKRTEKVYGAGHSTYYYQLEAFISEIQGGTKCETSGEDGVKTMLLIDQIYEKAGMLKRGLKTDTLL
eukprot:TRINITY_DN4655_c0_g1_i1.p1 TRINITY_DN4655_c0_g1~~TRINITY_DN4655_c0_g1_i1.p1  ORF type:complete len:358 (-),score=64.77 TRINITY_DN4655_c0_g1_i1:3-1076(-)